MALDYTGYPNTVVDVNYPQGKAKDASGATALDGTPWTAIQINDYWGLLQALLKRSGITPSGSPDNANVSDYADAIMIAMSKEFDYTASVVVHPSDTDSRIDIITADTSGGNITITLPSPPFNGKEYIINSIGSGLTYVKGPGVYLGSSSLGTPISEGLSFRAIAIDGVLYPVNQITADYNSGDFNIKQHSDGVMEILNSSQFNIDVAGFGSDILTFPIAMESGDYYSNSSANDFTSTGQSVVSVLCFKLNVSVEVFYQVIMGAPAASTVDTVTISKGKY